MDIGFDITSIITTLISVGSLYVAITNRLTRLETREEERSETANQQINELKAEMRKHNNLIERVTALEGSTKTLFRYYDEIREDLKEVK